MRVKTKPIIRQLESGKWAAFVSKTSPKYYLATVRDTEREATIARLHDIGRNAQDVIDSVDNQLRELGALDEQDPHGYLC